MTTELSWLSRILHEMNVSSVTPTPVKCDSQTTIYIALNPMFHERTKYVELDCHFIRERLQDGRVDFSTICSYSIATG